jgi:hypothetical protein
METQVLFICGHPINVHYYAMPVNLLEYYSLVTNCNMERKEIIKLRTMSQLTEFYQDKTDLDDQIE